MDDRVSVTIAASGYSTLSSKQALDFAQAIATTDGADALKAFVATAATASSVTLTEVTAIAANEDVVVRGTPGATYQIPVVEHADAAATNLLKPSATLTGDGTEFLLSGGQFYKASAGVLPEGKAYLKLPTAADAHQLAIVFEGVTGVDDHRAPIADDGTFYTLSGVRVQQPAKGLYIRMERSIT